MKRSVNQPELLGIVLQQLAARIKKVDLMIIDEIRELWPTLIDPAVARVCQPEFVKNQVLVISVPSGAFAQQIALDEEAILGGLASLADRAPTSLKTVQKP